MRLTYCAEWGFRDQAAGLAAAIQTLFDLEVELIAGHDGICEVVLGDEVVFSNRDHRGKLPTEWTVLTRLARCRKPSVGDGKDT